MNLATEFNPMSPEFQANPYPYYDMLRTHAPAFYWQAANMWFLTRYDDCVAMLKDNRFGHEISKVMTREELGWGEPSQEFAPLWETQRQWMLLKDPPDHTRLRTLVHKAFTPKMIERLRLRAELITNDLIDKAQPHGGMDLINEFALLLPVTVIAEMLGVPPADYEILHGWSRGIADTLEFFEGEEIAALGTQATVEFSDYLCKLIAERRKEPKDDLISALVAAEAEGDKLSESEMVAMCILLLFAGHETTVNLIGNGTLALMRNRDQWEKLKANPALVKSAVEELLRYDSPVQSTSRWALEDMDIAGQRIRKGQSVAPMFGAANHDPARFTNPNELDITRDPNPHIAFGNGIHFCLGAPLARMEGQIAFRTLAQRLPNLQIVDESPPYRPTLILRGLAHLPVTF
ncbi:MAG TPA: cytochrome P450 [Phototrophicaceae bacterium]|nr:cytochrome P450 [Phototrophicaceae bacterium]